MPFILATPVPTTHRGWLFFTVTVKLQRSEEPRSNQVKTITPALSISAGAGVMGSRRPIYDTRRAYALMTHTPARASGSAAGCRREERARDFDLDQKGEERGGSGAGGVQTKKKQKRRLDSCIGSKKKPSTAKFASGYAQKEMAEVLSDRDAVEHCSIETGQESNGGTLRYDSQHNTCSQSAPTAPKELTLFSNSDSTGGLEPLQMQPDQGEMSAMLLPAQQTVGCRSPQPDASSRLPSFSSDNIHLQPKVVARRVTRDMAAQTGPIPRLVPKTVSVQTVEAWPEAKERTIVVPAPAR